MNAIRLIPIVLSFLLLAAHFYRSAHLVPAVLCIGIVFLLFFRRPWIPRMFQVLLVLGALEWLRALYVFAAMRIAWDQPWTRLAIILGAVALFTALSGVVFQNKKLRSYYQA